MRYLLKCGIWGIVGIILISIILSPYMCYSISQDYNSVKCYPDYVLFLFLQVYANPYAILLLALGFFIGAGIGKLISSFKERKEFLEEKIFEEKRRNYKF